MPGEVIDRPNPKALPSLLPDNVIDLAVKLDKLDISRDDLTSLEAFRRASNYIAAGWLLCMQYVESTNKGSYDIFV